MPSISTFGGYYNVPGPVSATATAVADYHAIGGNTTGGFTQQTVQTGTTRLILGVPAGSAMFAGGPFLLRAIGKTVSAVASNFTMAIYWNCGANTNLTTFTNDVSIVTSSTQAVASVGGYIALNARLMWDDVNKQLMGVGDLGMASIPTTPVALNGPGVGTINATNPIAVSSTAAQAAIANDYGCQFFVVMTNSGAVTSTKLVEFSINEL